MKLAVIDLAAAREALRSHDLSELFTKILGWSTTPAFIRAINCANQRCVPIAQGDRRIVWQVILADRTRFTPALRAQLYSAICLYEQSVDGRTPLMIVLDQAKTRSLWYLSPSESALYVANQPIALWNYRLQRLADSEELSLVPGPEAESLERFEELFTKLSEAINGIEDISHQRGYAALTLRRLMLIQQVQQKGWLAGDTWYLQSRFGARSPKQGRFFESCLQPLYQGLAMPEVERPIALQQTVGPVPFLGGLFHQHRLETAYSQISIADSALEEVLGWLSEQASAEGLNPWTSGALGYWLSLSVEADRMDRALDRGVCDRLLDSSIQQPLTRSTEQGKNSKTVELQTLDEQLFNADARECRALIQEILPALRILDPACGSGHLLVAFHCRLTEIFSILSGYIQQNQDTQLDIWHSGLLQPSEETSELEENYQPADFVQTIQKRILSNMLYGVDISADAVESARLYLTMHWVETAVRPAEIEPLVDLEFNLLAGNALVGFITVDEERFDQVDRAGTERVLQGNLLQPLAADSYQMILSEKNIALEHYQSRSVLLAEVHNVPNYARTALLKEEISALDQKAQQKLDRLLLDHMSQQLGIRYRATQLENKPHYRPLTRQDIEKLQPFHFGYHFGAIIKRGGFDIVACHPPGGPFSPSVTEFMQQFPALAQRHRLQEKAFKTSKPALIRENAEVAGAWLSYRDQYAYMTDYLRRSELYACQNSEGSGETVRTKAIRKNLVGEQLFVERCSRLLATGGFGLVAVSMVRWRELGTQRLWPLLQRLGARDISTVDELVAGETAGEMNPGVVSWQQGKI